MKIGVLTYEIPHRKTQDIVFRLKALGYDDVTGIIQPYIKRKLWKPIYRSRPEGILDISPELFFDRLGYKSINVNTIEDLNENFDRLLIGGARILSKKEIRDLHIINVHTGYLPYARGLDALKWSIYYDWKIGVTAHYIDEEIDLGYLIEQRLTPLYPNDSFHSIAARHYELEIKMMVRALANEKQIRKCPLSIVDEVGLETPAPVFRRMPLDKEVVMMKRLERRLERLND